MATPPYSTAVEVLDSDLSIKVTQSNWNNTTDIEDRIKDADAFIQGCLGQLGYPTTFTDLAATPQVVRSMSKLLARAMVWRDLYHRSPSSNASDTSKGIFDQVDAMIKKLKEGTLELIDPVTGLVVDAVPIDQAVHSNTLKVPRALTMADPEKQHIHDDLYSDRTVLGNQQTLTDDDANI